MKNFSLTKGTSRCRISAQGHAEAGFHRLATFWAIPLVLISFLLGACASIPAPVGQGPLDASVLVSAWENLWKDNYALAESSFREALAARPDDQEANRGMALVLYAEGKEEEAAVRALNALRYDLASPYASALHSFAVEVMPDGKKTVQALKELADKETLRGSPSRVARRGNLFLTEYYRFFAPDAGKIRSTAEALGIVSGWKLLGAFSDASSSGLDKAFIDEADQDTWGSGHFSADDGRSLSWTMPDKLPPDGFVRPESYLGYEYWGSVFYAFAEVKVQKDGDFRLALERRGAFKLWIDGAAVASDKAERLSGEYATGVLRLKAGSHKILVKIASEEKVAGFRLSLLPDVPEILSVKDAQARIAGLRGAADGDANMDLASLLAEKAARGGPDIRYWSARQLFSSGYYLAALDEIARARKGPEGKSALFDQVESACLSGLGRKNEARAALLRSQNDERCFAPAVVAQLDQYIEEQRFLEAALLLQKVSFRVPQWRAGALESLSLALASSGDVYAKAKDYAAQFPDSPDAALLLAQKGLGFGYDLKSLAAEIREKGRPTEADRLLLNYASKTGNYADVYTLASARSELYPDSASLRYLVETSAGRTGRLTLDEAIKRARDLTLSFPGSTDLALLDSDLAETKLILAQKDSSEQKSGTEQTKLTEARDQYVQALRSLLWLHPSKYEYRKQLRTAMKLPDLDKTETLTQIGPAITEYESARKAKPISGADAEVVLDKSTTVFFGDGASRFYRLRILKILSQAGVEAETSQELGPGYGREVTQAFVLKPDGARTEGRIGAESVSYPGLSPGDYLVLRYQGDSYSSGALAKQFWVSQAFQFDYPAHSVQADFVYPWGADPRIEYRNLGSLDIRRRNETAEEGMMRSSLKASDLPAAPSGRFSPDGRDSALWIDVSSLRSWSPISDWYRDLFYGRALPTDPVTATAGRLTEGISDRRGKIAKLYNFVADSVIYEDLSFMYSAYIPQRAESVLEDRFGDCKDKCALLVALLAACDIDSEVVLSAPDYRGVTPYLPSTRFTHVLVRVPDPTGDLFLDPTAEHSTFPYLAEYLHGSWYLPIPRDAAAKTELARIPFKADWAPTSVFLEVALGDDAQPSVEGSSTMSGEFAYLLRKSLSPASPDKRKELVFSLMSSLLPGFGLSTYEVKGLDGSVEGQDPNLDFSGRLPTMAKGEGPSTVPLPWITGLPAALLAYAGAGSGPLEVDYPTLYAPLKETIVLHLPEGWRSGALPKDAEFKFGSAYASFHYSSVGSSLICVREIRLPYLVVEPSDREAFATFLRSVAAKGRETISAGR